MKINNIKYPLSLNEHDTLELFLKMDQQFTPPAANH